MTESDNPRPRARLVVLYGGKSAEHDVSCVSAVHVLGAADRDRYDIVPVGITRTGRWMLDEQTAANLAQGSRTLPERVEVTGSAVEPPMALASPDPGVPTVVFPLVHGPHGEDGTLQGMLELAGVPFVGAGVLGSAICMDKAMAKTLAAARGIPQCRALELAVDTDGAGALAGRAESLMSQAGIDYPVFVKPANMGSSVGISKVRDLGELVTALEVAFSYDERAVIEESVLGREIEIAVLGNTIGAESPRASLPGEIVPGAEFYDYTDKYASDTAQILIPADLDETGSAEVRQLALDAYAALRCDGLARVDFFYEPDGRGFLLNEINTMPGFTPLSMYAKLWEATGLEFPALIDELVRLALERHDRRSKFRTDA